MRLQSFENEHIAGLTHLLHLALQSPHPAPPRFLFCSSTASARGQPTGNPIPESISQDPHSASALGYSRSKWVAEAICAHAHRQTRLRSHIAVLRIGQLCGDTRHGIWNMAEAWPLMLSSLGRTSALPDLEDQPLDWLPVDLAAIAISQIASSPSLSPLIPVPVPLTPVFHILNQNRTSTWTDLLTWLSHRRDFDILPPTLWLRRLRLISDSHPARKLLGLWERAYGDGEGGGGEDANADGNGDGDGDGTGEIRFEMEKTMGVARVMAGVEAVDEAFFLKLWDWIVGEMEGGNE